MSSVETVTDSKLEIAEAEIEMPERKRSPAKCIKKEEDIDLEKMKMKLRKYKNKKAWLEVKIEDLKEEIAEWERIFEI